MSKSARKRANAKARAAAEAEALRWKGRMWHRPVIALREVHLSTEGRIILFILEFRH